MVMALAGNKADVEDKRKVTAEVSVFFLSFFLVALWVYVVTPTIFLFEVTLIALHFSNHLIGSTVLVLISSYCVWSQFYSIVLHISYL